MIVRIDVDVRGAETLKKRLIAAARDLSPVMKLAPSIIRKGPGSISEQIQRRAYMAEDGSIRPWQEPSILPASGRSNPRVLAGEEIMWRAARGESAASITRTGPAFAVVGVNDLLIRQEAARLGNEIVSGSPYFSFVTGEWSRRTSPAPAIATKPTRRIGRPGPRTGLAPKVRPENLTAYTVKYAMWWFLGYTYGIWLTESQLRAGVMTPPKNIGWNPVLIERLRDAVTDHVIAAAGGDSGSTARGRANDPALA